MSECVSCPDTETEYRPELGCYVCDRCYDNPSTITGKRFSEPYNGGHPPKWRDVHPLAQPAIQPRQEQE